MGKNDKNCEQDQCLNANCILTKKLKAYRAKIRHLEAKCASIEGNLQVGGNIQAETANIANLTTNNLTTTSSLSVPSLNVASSLTVPTANITNLNSVNTVASYLSHPNVMNTFTYGFTPGPPGTFDPSYGATPRIYTGRSQIAYQTYPDSTGAVMSESNPTSQLVALARLDLTGLDTNGNAITYITSAVVMGHSITNETEKTRALESVHGMVTRVNGNLQFIMRDGSTTPDLGTVTDASLFNRVTSHWVSPYMSLYTSHTSGFTPQQMAYAKTLALGYPPTGSVQTVVTNPNLSFNNVGNGELYGFITATSPLYTNESPTTPLTLQPKTDLRSAKLKGLLGDVFKLGYDAVKDIF